jgi:hypothetical protein
MRRCKIIRRRPSSSVGVSYLVEQPPHCDLLRLSLSTARFVRARRTHLENEVSPLPVRDVFFLFFVFADFSTEFQSVEIDIGVLDGVRHLTSPSSSLVQSFHQQNRFYFFPKISAAAMPRSDFIFFWCLSCCYADRIVFIFFPKKIGVPCMANRGPPAMSWTSQ